MGAANETDMVDKEKERIVGSGAPTSGEKWNILIVDDNETICALLCAVLNNNKRTATYASTRQKALQALRDQHFDICFLDLYMPDVQSFELLYEVRTLAPEIKIVIITGNQPDEDLMQTIRQHAVLLLIKPFDLMRLETVIEKIMENNITTYQNYANLIDDKRRHGRQPFTGSGTFSLYQYRPGAADYDLHSRADTVDISQNGLGIRTSIPLEPGRTVRLSNERETLCGVVRWSVGGEYAETYRAGIQFVKCND